MSDELEESINRILSRARVLTPEERSQREDASRKENERHRNIRIQNLKRASNIPERHAGTHPESRGEWGQKLELLKPRLGTGILIGLVGIRGGGKTQMAVELIKACNNQLRSALFTTAVDFFITIKRTYRNNSDQDEMEVLNRFKTRHLLVIDEIGKRGETDWENNLLFEVINSRYNSMLDTVIIDNRSKQDFINTIGPSLASRMNECGGIVECNWGSFRG